MAVILWVLHSKWFIGIIGHIVVTIGAIMNLCIFGFKRKSILNSNVCLNYEAFLIFIANVLFLP